MFHYYEYLLKICSLGTNYRGWKLILKIPFYIFPAKIQIKITKLFLTLIFLFSKHLEASITKFK